MAGVQELPPWLSYSQFVTTNAAGSRTTASTIVYLPLTYYGPSIPLGTDGVWVYGGLTSPASTSTRRPSPSTTRLPTLTVGPGTTSSAPPSSPSATTSVPTSTIFSTLPTASSSTPLGTTGSSTSGISTSTTPISTSSTETSTSSTTTSPTTSETSTSTSSPTSTPTSRPTESPSPSSSTTSTGLPTAMGGGRTLNSRAIVAIVIVSVFMAVLIGLLCFLAFRRRRRRAGPPTPAQESGTNWNAYAEVPPEADSPTESRPGHGEQEQDPLVARASSDGGYGDPVLPFIAPRLVTTGQTVSREALPSNRTSAASHAQFGTAYTLDQDSDHGVPPTPLVAAAVPARSSDSPLAPPRTLNPDFLPVAAHRSNNSSINSTRSTVPSIAYPDSPVSDIDETAALMTARRVRVDSGVANRQSGTWSLSGLARFGRLSWFARPSDDQSSHNGSRPGSSSMQLPESHPPEMVEAHRGISPIPAAAASSLSENSVRSQYFDAVSRPGSPFVARGVTSSRQDLLDLPVPPSAMSPLRRTSSRPEHLAVPPGLTPPQRPATLYDSSSTDSDGLTVPIVVEDGSDDPLEERPPSSAARWDSIRSSTTGNSSVGRASLQGLSGHYVRLSDGGSLGSMRSHVGLSPHGSGSREESHNDSGSGSHASLLGGTLHHSNSITSDGRRRVRRPEEAFSPAHRSSHGTFGRHGSEPGSIVSRGPSPQPSVVFAPLESLTLSSQSSNGSRGRVSTSATATTSARDTETGLAMHFPSRPWNAEQHSEAEWPSDAWTEFPEGGARWWGTPRTLKEYQAHTGDSGVV